MLGRLETAARINTSARYAAHIPRAALLTNCCKRKARNRIFLLRDSPVTFCASSDSHDTLPAAINDAHERLLRTPKHQIKLSRKSHGLHRKECITAHRKPIRHYSLTPIRYVSRSELILTTESLSGRTVARARQTAVCAGRTARSRRTASPKYY